MKTRQAIEEFLNSRLSSNLSSQTIQWYRQRLEKFDHFCPKLPERPGPIEAFLTPIGGSPETRDAYFRVLRALFRFISSRHDSSNPMLRVLHPRCPRKIMATLDAAQVMRLLLSARDLRDRTLLTLLIDTGMRTGEAASLRKQDINTNTVQVRGKCGEREIPISEETGRLLTNLSKSSKDCYIFQGHKGPLTRHGIYQIVRRCMTDAAIPGPKLGAHRIRHAFGKGYLVSGGDLRSLQQIMGHANITTTEKYTALSLADIADKHHKFTLLRAAQAAAQGILIEQDAVLEAEKIVRGAG